MNVETIQQKLEKEKNEVIRLEKKRDDIEEMIKRRKGNIERLQRDFSSHKFNETTDVLSANGLTLDEIMAAIKKGDLSSLQEKLKPDNADLVSV